MATDRSLSTLLRTLQILSSSAEDANRLLSSATTLLVLLTNPRNVSLLTSQILTAPAIWQSPDLNVRISLQVLTTFHSAARHILQREAQKTKPIDPFATVEGLPREEWIRAVIKGADERSPRWKHLLVLGGVLSGFEAHNKQGLPLQLKEHMEEAIVTATNLALQEPNVESDLVEQSVVMVLSHSFDLLRSTEKEALDVDRLLLWLMKTMFSSAEGFRSGYFLGIIDADIVQNGNRFSWPERSPSFYQTRTMATGPIVSALGSISRIASFCIENIQPGGLLFRAVEDLSAFSRSLSIQWQQNKLSELDITEEEQFLDQDTLQKTLPLLWQQLKSAMFSTIIVENGIIGRALRDRHIPVTQMVPIATQTLHTLRNLYFIISRIGHDSFSQFNFVFTAAIDILAQYPRQAENFLREIKPRDLGRIASHPYERCLDLFFLNTAEHLTLILREEFCMDILLQAAIPYLGTGGDHRLNEIFEAAHSVFLAAFSAPHNHNITTSQLPNYIVTLFSVFPQQLSARQFQLAIKILVRIASPPSRLAETQPLLAESILEMVRYRAITSASKHILPTLASQNDSAELVPMSEQSALILSLIGAIPFLSLQTMQDWLPLTAEAVCTIEDPILREVCSRTFWECLSQNLDVPRAEYCVRWWNDMGGRQAVLNGQTKALIAEEGPFMSGALGEKPRL